MRIVSIGSVVVSWRCWPIVSLLTMRKATKRNMKKMIFVRIFIMFSAFVGAKRKNEKARVKKSWQWARQSVILQSLRSKAQQQKYQT